MGNGERGSKNRAGEWRRKVKGKGGIRAEWHLQKQELSAESLENS